jgi:hypothetical protein
MNAPFRPLARSSLRRFEAIERQGSRVRLADDHRALVNGGTIFPSRVFPTGTRPRLLISGHNSRKIGKVVTKGKWRGMPIFTLTLEERATCPRSCQQWKTCYGNNMHHAVRHAHGPEFEAALWEELADKQAEHPDGFVVRLHILGDFYSVDYAELWAEALEAYPALRVFGYTAHAPQSPTGEVIAQLLGVHPGRWAIRFSGLDAPTDGSVVVDCAEETVHMVCPAQRHDAAGKPLTDCCATCTLCWATDRTIAFLRH